jgi:uncharacterized phage protein (predicted DNA packaging)
MRISEITDFYTLDEVKAYLRVSHTADDGFISDLMEIAKEQADAFMQNDFTAENDTGEWVDTPVPFSVKLACFKMVASWYETKSDDITSINAGGVTVQLGDMPWSSKRLLYPYKRLVGL